MLNMVFDVGDAHVRLQAPEGWIRLGQRGSHVILRDPACPTPIFVEALREVGDVDAWIGRLAGGSKRLTSFRQSAGPPARRFVALWRSGGTLIERAYRVQRVPSYRSPEGVWVAASIDLDRENARQRFLSAIFPQVTPPPQLSGEVGLRQYLEQPSRSQRDTAPGFTLRLPLGHAIVDAAVVDEDSHRFLVNVGVRALGWMTIARSMKDARTAAAEIEALQRDRGASVQPLSDTASLVSFGEPASSAQAEREAVLSIALTDSAHLSIRVSSSLGGNEPVAFLRRVSRGLRVWSDDFQGYWQAPPRVRWTDSLPPGSQQPAPVPPQPSPPPVAAPPPVPRPDLRTEWESRLSGTVLEYSSSGSAGYDPRFSSFSYRTVRIALHRSHRVEWDETGHSSASYGGLYIGGPTREVRTGRWTVAVVGMSPSLVLDYGPEEGVHRFALGLTASGAITLDGLRYSVRR